MYNWKLVMVIPLADLSLWRMVLAILDVCFSIWSWRLSFQDLWIIVQEFIYWDFIEICKLFLIGWPFYNINFANPWAWVMFPSVNILFNFFIKRLYHTKVIILKTKVYHIKSFYHANLSLTWLELPQDILYCSKLIWKVLLPWFLSQLINHLYIRGFLNFKKVNFISVYFAEICYEL